MKDSKEILEDMGYNIEEMQKRNQLLIKTKAKSPYVCLCGHPVSSHTQTDEGDSYCKPSRMFCHCAKLNPVLKSEDNRNFYCKTNSYGAEHALTRGILTAMNRNKKVEWVEDQIFCMRKGCTVKGAGNGLQPVLLEYGLPAYPGGKLVVNYKLSGTSETVRDLRDVLLCPEHLDNFVLGSR